MTASTIPDKGLVIMNFDTSEGQEGRNERDK
jgi:hypothetical protein